MITTAFDCCCESPAPIGGCPFFAASVFNAACPAKVTIEGDFTFELYTSGGHSRGCLGMPNTGPLWGKKRRGPLHVTSTLYRVECNLSTPFFTQYYIQKSCTGTCATDHNRGPLLCIDDCPVPTGCRTYTAREDPCDENYNDEIGTEITKGMLLGMPLVDTRTMPCSTQFVSCSHFLGADGYITTPAPNNPPPNGTTSIVQSTATGSPLQFCPSCFQLDAPVLGEVNVQEIAPACTGAAICKSTPVYCQPCSYDINENPIVPHLRAAVTGISCYTIKDSNNNCVEAWIHISPPVIFAGPWRNGDPYVPVGIPNIPPGGSPSSYPRLLTQLSEGIVTPTGNAYLYPFTYAKQVISTPQCIPNGSYVMFGNMGSGLTPTLLNRCEGPCSGTNGANQTLYYSSTNEDFTTAFTACLPYFIRTVPFTGCYGLYQGAGPGDFPKNYGTATPLVACSTPQCCCRPYQQCTWTKYLVPGSSPSQWMCQEPIVSCIGEADPPICRAYDLKPFPVYTNLGQVTEYYANDFPRHPCRRGLGGSWEIRDRDIVTATCSYFGCCGSGYQCSDWDPDISEVIGPIVCGGIPWEIAPLDKIYTCNGGLTCPTGTCMYNSYPHGFSTHVYVHLLREFPAQITLTWN